MDVKITQLLADFVDTARHDDFNLDITLSKFPELQKVDPQLLADFVDTARYDDFDLNVTLPKFPEITGVAQEDEEPGKRQGPTIYRGTPVVGLEKSDSDSDGEETKQEDIFLAQSPDQVPDLVMEDFWFNTKQTGYIEGDPISYRYDLLNEYGNDWNAMQEAGVDGRIIAQLKREVGAKQTIFDAQQAQPEGEKTTLEEISGDIQSKLKEEAEVEALDYNHPEIDLRNMKTAVNKSAGDVAKAFDDSDEFPGLNVTNTSLIKGITNHLTFVLPDGTTIDADLRPSGGGEADAETAAQLEKVRQWYKEHGDDPRMEFAGLFRQFGERIDTASTSSTKLEGDKVDRLNMSLKPTGYEIESVVDTSRGSASTHYHLIKLHPRERVVIRPNLEGKGEFPNMHLWTPDIGDIQNYLWNNLDEAQINSLSKSATQQAVAFIQEEEKEVKESYAQLQMEQEFNRTHSEELRRGDDYYKIFLETIQHSEEISEASKAALKQYFDLKIEKEWNSSVISSDYKKVTEKEKVEMLLKALRSGELAIDLKQLHYVDVEHMGDVEVNRYESSHGAKVNGVEQPIHGKIQINVNNRAELIEQLQRMLTVDENGYDAVVTEQRTDALIQSKASRAGTVHMSGILSRVNEGSAETITMSDGTVVTVNPETAASGIDQMKSSPSYIKAIEGLHVDSWLKTDEGELMQGSFDVLQNAYETEAANMMTDFETDRDKLLGLMKKAGLGWEVSDNGVLTVIGTDKELVNRHQATWNDEVYAQRALMGKWREGYQALSDEFGEFKNKVINAGGTLDRDYDFADLMAESFWGGFADMGYGIGSFFSIDEAERRLQSNNAGKERLEMTYNYREAMDEHLKFRYALRSVATQGANLTVAIGTQFIPGAGTWLAPTLFGLSSGGQKRVELNQRMSAGEKAELALASLEEAWKKGTITNVDAYIDEKIRLEQTISLGDLSWLQVNGAVAMSGVIEGGISYALGTVPNSRAALEALKSAGKEATKGIFRNTGRAALDWLKATGKEMGGEIAEETLILLGDELSTGLITGSGYDGITWDAITETAIQAMMISGPMNGTSNAYNAIATQWVTKDARKLYGEDKIELERIDNALKELALKPTKSTQKSRDVLLAKQRAIYAKWNSEYAAETEVLAGLGGPQKLKALIEINVAKKSIYDKAGIDPRDSQADIDKKLEKYKKTISKQEAANVDTELDAIQDRVDDIYRQVESKFNGDPMAKGGSIETLYGEAGLEVARKIAERNPEYNNLTNKQKTLWVHNTMKQSFDNQRMSEAKKDKAAQKFVDMQVYGYEGGSKKTKGRDGKASKKDRVRKTNNQIKAEDSIYRAWAMGGLSRASQAIEIAAEGNISARHLLNDDLMKNVKFEQKDSTQDFIEYITKNAKSLGIVDLEGTIAKVKDGRIKAFVGQDGKAISLDAEQSNNNLRRGDLLQATAVQHEFSHAQDALAMSKDEKAIMAQALERDAQKNKLLKRISDDAIRSMVNLGDVGSRNGFKRDSQGNVLPLNKQSREAQDEYSQRFQDLLRRDKEAMAAARKQGAGLGNLFRGFTGGDFKFKNNRGKFISGSGMNYAIGFLDAFAEGKISAQTGRKIANRIIDPNQVAEEHAKIDDEMMTSEEAGAKETAKQRKKRVSEEAKQASDDIQQGYKDIQAKIEDGTLKGGEFVDLASRFEAYVNGIVNRHSKRPGFKDLKQDIINRILYEDARGVMGLMQSYNDNLGVPLAAYVFEQLNPKGREGRAKEIIDGILPESFDKRIDSEEGTSDIVDTSQDIDFDLQEKIRASGVKLWTRLGSIGLDIHNTIIKSVLAGEVDTKGKNWKTLQTPQAVYDAVFEMMGIEPKPGNLTKGDIKNAQRWLDKHLGEFIAAVPKHHTTKMVKGKDGKLEVRPDKAIGIPNVILEVMFNKGTRVDNLTPWHRKTDILDSEVLAIFGIMERDNPNLYKKETNTSARIRAAAKIVADAMYNQGVRVGMDINGDPVSDIVAVSDGKGRALFSEEASIEGQYDSFDTISTDEIQKHLYTLQNIALKVGWGSPEFDEQLSEKGVPLSVVAFANSIRLGDRFADQPEGFKKPLRGRLKSVMNDMKAGKPASQQEIALLADVYLKDNAGTEASQKQTADSSIDLINTLSPSLVKALGPAFFGLTGSRRGIGSPNPNSKSYTKDAARVRALYDEKTAGVTNAGTVWANVKLLQAGTGVMKQVADILKMDITADAKKALVAKKIGLGKIDKINAANIKALNLVIRELSKVNPANRAGVLRLLELATNNGKGTRGLTTLSAIEYLDGPQALYSYKNAKGEITYTNDAINKKDQEKKGFTEFSVNQNHPLYPAAEFYADKFAKAEGKLLGWTEAEINEAKQLKIKDVLTWKGEHVDPSANVNRILAESLLDYWYRGGSLATLKIDVASATAGFKQTLGAKLTSDLQDQAHGSTSNYGDYRLSSLKGEDRLKPSDWANVKKGKNKLTPSEYNKLLDMIDIEAMQDVRGTMGITQITQQLLADKQTIEDYKADLRKIRDGDPGKTAELKKSPVNKGATDAEARESRDSARKATAEAAFSEEAESKGMTAWDFDDTLATTKSNVIFTKEGETKIVSAEDFAKEGANLIADGWTPDFSEFNKVTGGEPGPMFEKAMERARKYGTKDTYILTARAPESAVAIKEFLDALGLDIPLKNITGLGNSTGEAKARWLLNKHAEGYNDIAFVDDAMQNIDAVNKVFNEFDIKGKVEQAKAMFSEEASVEINNMLDEGQQEIDDQFQKMLEETTGTGARKTFSAVKARQRGKNKGRFKFFLPPSAEDFKGLMYSFMGKGRTGEKHHKFMKVYLFDPFSKGTRTLNAMKHEVASDVRALKKAIPGIKGKLRQNVGDTNFTNEQAVRVYNWVQSGIDIPGLSQADQAALVRAVEQDSDLTSFAGMAQDVGAKTGVDSVPGNAWLAGSISSDINEQIDRSRQAHLQEWQGNVDAMFSEKNLNKIEAIYGANFREALEDSLYRMKTGSMRPQGQSRLMNNFMNWINGSVGTTMFFNARSAMLQMISNVNFINWHDNNPIKAAKAFGNQKQYWSDVAMIFNSPWLKQRRGGIGTDLNAAELLRDMQDSPNKMKTAIAKLLQLGFTPTQIADSLAIATGGATMYRNRIKTHMDAGMTKAEAESKAFEDMMEVAEETQQSARPDKISQQQASPLGKLILAFQNTPMQYNRIMKRAAQDWINGRGDPKEHLSKIVYYGGVQSMIFYGLQTAMFSALFGDDDEDDMEEKQARVLNGMMDSILRGSGITGAVVSTAKNTILEFIEQDAKNEDGEFYTDPNHAYTVIEALNLSPPIGIKARKLYSSTQTWQFNRDVIDHMSKTDLDNPIYDATFSATEAITNLPLSRLYNKYQNISEAMNSDNETWQRVAMLLGWSKWSFGIKNQDVMTAKQEVKEIKAEEKKVRAKEKKEQKEAETQAANEAVIQGHIDEQQQQRDDGVSEDEITCAAVKRNGERCGKTVLPGQTYCTIHEKVEQRSDGEKKQCTHVKSNGDRCKMQTSNKSGKCYYHD